MPKNAMAIPKRLLPSLINMVLSFPVESGLSTRHSESECQFAAKYMPEIHIWGYKSCPLLLIEVRALGSIGGFATAIAEILSPFTGRDLLVQLWQFAGVFRRISEAGALIMPGKFFDLPSHFGVFDTL